ncbi:MAG: ABC transporter permease [Candidatus Bipolaricaulaceae bacterium]
MLLLGSFSQRLGRIGPFTIAKYVTVYTDPNFPKIIENTLIFVLSSSALATFLGTALAFLNVRTDIPGKGVFQILPLIPMMFPHVLFAAAWIMLLNPSNGLVNVWLRSLFGLSNSFGPINIYSLGGMIFMEGLLDVPVTFMVIAPAMYAFDPALEEAARISGAGLGQVLRRVTLPLVRPAVLAAFMLAVIRGLAAFAVPQMVGIPGRVQILTTYIYRIISIGWSPDYGKAAAVGVLVLIAALILIYLYRSLTAGGERFVTVTGKGYRPRVVKLGWARYPLFLGVLLFFLVLVVLPFLVLVYMSFLPYVLPPGPKAWGLFSLSNWTYALGDPIAGRAMRNTAILAVVGATAAVTLSLSVAYVVTRIRTPLTALLDSLTFMSYAFPGLIIGIGFMWFLVHTPLYGTVWALLLAYAGTYLPYGVRPLGSAFFQIHKDLEDSGRVCGASFLGTFRRIVVPLVIPGVFSAWTLLAAMFVRELSVAAVLARPGSEVLSVQVLKYAYDGLWGRVSALGIIMIIFSSVLVAGANGIRHFLTRNLYSE